ncbi:Biorientation of chromosomes in cell division protein 1-like 1, partial [Eufriesea mexicana]
MELGLPNTLLAGDPRLVDHIVGEVKSQGIFDQFRKECIADVDTKPAYQNLRTRVEGSVNSFLSKQSWKPDLNKNQLRETLRKHIHEAPYLDAGVERIVDQVVNPKVYSVFMTQIEDVVYKFLGIERPKAKEKNGACGLKDLLPKDLDPVSPESDKNSLKDVSLESVDAMEDLEIKKDIKLVNEQKFQEEEIFNEKDKDNISENGQISSEEKALDESDKIFNKTGSILNLNISGKSDDKTEEDEEDSPTFEPIDIMNLNESNNSNDSHLSGISELTSHRSRSPDFCNELSRDNFDYSNQDSQLNRDGSNGSSSKSSQSSSSSSNIASSKSSTSTFSKETNHMSNSGSETSDNIEEVHTSDLKLSLEQQSSVMDRETELHTEYKTDSTSNYETHVKQELEFNYVNLPLKKRAIPGEDNSISGEMKVKKPKFAKNIHEAKKLMKIRKQIEKQKLKENKKLEKKFIQKIEQPIQSNTVNNDNFESMPDEERVQIIEIPDEEYEEPYPEKHTNLTLEERSIIMLQTEVGTKDLLETHSNLKLRLSDMELRIEKSLIEALLNKTEEESAQQSSSNTQTKLSENEEVEDLQNKESLPSAIEETNSNLIRAEKINDSMETCSKKETQQETSTSKLEEYITFQESSNYFSVNTNKTDINEKKEHLMSSSTSTEDVTCSNNNRSIEIPTTSKFINEDVSQNAQNKSLSNLNRYVTDGDCIIKVKEELQAIESTSMETEDNEYCRYFKADNEKSEKFSNFLESLELVKNSSLEDIIESLGGQVVSSMPKAMAPPLPKRKHSSSPLTDILLNNSNNNNDGHKKVLNLSNEEALNNIKKRKLIPKKQRLQANICAPQGLLNGENFVMPLSPESDVSATSEKIPSSNLIKEDK